MALAEHEASTLDEYQIATSPQIRHRGYCYFLLQENIQVATSTGVLWPSAAPQDYLFSVSSDTESATVFCTFGVYGKPEPFLPDESINKQIMVFAGSFDIIQNRVQADSYPESFDSVSTDTPQMSADNLQIEQSVLNIFDTYEHEEFDTDTAYDFTDDLERLIRADGKPVIRIINHLINKHLLDNTLVSETLRALGRIEDDNTKNTRYELLISSIKEDSVIIRDGAVSGLSFLDDKRALSQLRMLFEREALPILKNNIKVAIRSLEIY